MFPVITTATTSVTAVFASFPSGPPPPLVPEENLWDLAEWGFYCPSHHCQSIEGSTKH